MRQEPPMHVREKMTPEQRRLYCIAQGPAELYCDHQAEAGYETVQSELVEAIGRRRPGNARGDGERVEAVQR